MSHVFSYYCDGLSISPISALENSLHVQTGPLWDDFSTYLNCPLSIEISTRVGHYIF